MAIAAYHSWGELIYHLFVTDLLRSIFNLFSTVSFKKLSSSCCNNAARIALFSVAGEYILRYRAVPLTSQIVRNVNVNVNLDLCFTLFRLSCELVGYYFQISSVGNLMMMLDWTVGHFHLKCDVTKFMCLFCFYQHFSCLRVYIDCFCPRVWSPHVRAVLLY